MLIMLSIILVQVFNVPHVLAAENNFEAKLKAGFVYNFIKIEQPKMQPVGYYKLCVAGNSSINEVLPELNHKKVHGVAIKIINILPNESPANCDSLFIGKIIDQSNIDFLIKVSKENSVLTMSDVSSYLDLGVVISLKQLQGKLRFDVNLKSARESNIMLNAHLLRLAHFIVQ